MAKPLVLPYISLVDRDSGQMGEQVGQANIVVAFYPYHLAPAASTRKMTHLGEKEQVFAGELAEVEVRKDVAQQYQPAEGAGANQVNRIDGATYLGAEMQIGEQQCVA